MSRRRGQMVLLASLLGLGAALVVPSAAVARQTTSASAGQVLSLKLNGVVDPWMASYVKRGITTAETNQNAGVLLQIDTPGGLDSSMRQIVQAVLASRVPVLCFTAPSGARAASAGTFIMMACPVSAMAPGTNIGAAHPVGVSGAIEIEKVTNDAAAYIRSLADRWHRNADWAERAVRVAISAPTTSALNDHVVDLVEPGAAALLDEAGRCSSSEAASTSCPTTGALALGFPSGVAGSNLSGATVVPFGMSVGERLFHSLADPNIAFLLVMLGFIALIVWIFHPGIHISLGVGIVSLAIGFAILQTLPVQLVGFILLLVAAVLFVLDVKAKAHGVLTAAGIATLILGGLLLFNPSVPTAQVSRPLLVVVAVGVGLFTMFALRALLSAKGAPVRTGREALQGSTGLALTDLAPGGRVRVQRETWTADSVAGAVPKGQAIRVVSVQGVKLLVEPVAEPVSPAAAGGAVRADDSPQEVGSGAASGPAREGEPR